MKLFFSAIAAHFLLAAIFLLSFNLTAKAQSVKTSPNPERAKAMTLVAENKYLDAYPLLEKLVVSLPNDIEIVTHFGIAIAARSVTFSDPKIRKTERKRAYEVLSKAKALGTTNVMALNFLDQLPPDGGVADNFATDNPEVEAALREGEGYFGKGDYQKAFLAYERAYKLDPKSYEAALFVGDTFYAQNKYAEAEPWFAKAVAINNDRELAYRYWGDALMSQNKIKEATEKFIDAFVAEPYSRYSWENINKLTRKYGKQVSVITISPPGNEAIEEISIKPELLSVNDGTKHWQKFTEVRDAWRKELFRKAYPGVAYRDSLQERVAALKAVAEAASHAVKSGEFKNPHHSISNLILLNEKGLIESYILLLTPNDDIAEDYELYRKDNREKLRKFLSEYVFVFEK